MPDSRHVLRTDPQPNADPQPAPQPAKSKTTTLEFFILAAMLLMLMDFWFEVERGFGIPEAIVRVFLPLITKGGR